MPPDDAPAPEVPPSSRLCVKNIPKYVDEKRLKEFFSAKGEVTDVKVLRTNDGRSRQLGFIGFKSVDEAGAALRYFDRAYMDTMKLTVEYARKVGDDQLPRAWSKHTAGTTAHRKLAAAAEPVAGAGAAEGKAAGEGGGAKGKEKAKAKIEPLPEDGDAKLREFMALMQPRAKARIWGNEELPDEDAGNTAAAAAAATARASAAERQRQKRLTAAAKRAAADGDDDDGGDDEDEDEQYQDWTDAVAAARRAGSGEGSDDEEMADGGGRGDGDSDGDDGDGGGDAAGAAGLDGLGGGRVVVNEAVSDLEYLRSRMRRWDEDDEDIDDAAAAAAAKDQERGGAAGAGKKLSEAEAAARGDQSGVGTSPRCPVAEGAGGKAGRKDRKAAAPQPASYSDDLDAHTQDAHGDGGADVHGDGGAGAGEDADGDAEMAEPGGAEGQQQQQRRPWQRAGAGGAGAAGGEEVGEDTILETGRLFVRNLAYTATEPDMRDLFGTYGDLQEVHLVLDRETKRSKGLAYVQYQIPEDAVRAAQQLDGTIYQGRLLHILPAKRAPGSEGRAAAATTAAAGEGASEEGQPGEGAPGGGPPGTSSYKTQRDAQRKADAGNRAAWNTLFMRPDTVADAVAAHYGLSKAALLDPLAGGSGGDSVAVSMALGEAQVIAATKQALAEAGVSIEALERAAAASGKASAVRSVARSGTALLVKNLPFTADEDELAAMFGRCGPLARLVLPPARALAVVEFSEPQDARAAFRSLAYKKYHHVPLYLEWAPADAFTAPPPTREQQKQAQQQQQRQPQAAKETKAGGKGANAAAPDAAAALGRSADGDGDGDGGDGAADANPSVVGTIYVKNLAFATTDAALRKQFDGAVSAAGGSLHSAVVARKKAKDGAVQSLGYGFVEVDSEVVAAAVIKKLQGSLLDGHKLALQLSKGRKDAAGGAAKPGSSKKGGEQEGSTKLVLRNLAFEATKKDIQGLFNPFGHLKSCRLPKKFDGSHRGFAFVEFVTKQEARNAFEGVGGTHLYGRRLVVEYAREDDGLDEIRNKIAAKFKHDGDLETGGAPAKRLKV